MHLLASRDIVPSPTCPRCNAHPEDISHLLLSCSKSASLWSLIWAKLRLPLPITTLDEWWRALHGQQLGAGAVKTVRQAWIAYAAWLLWIDRNNVSFNNRAKSVSALFETVHYLVIEQLSTAKLEVDAADLHLLLDWGLQPSVAPVKQPILIQWHPLCRGG